MPEFIGEWDLEGLLGAPVTLGLRGTVRSLRLNDPIRRGIMEGSMVRIMDLTKPWYPLIEET